MGTRSKGCPQPQGALGTFTGCIQVGSIRQNVEDINIATRPRVAPGLRAEEPDLLGARHLLEALDKAGRATAKSSK
jgi:hypothetical protein